MDNLYRYGYRDDRLLRNHSLVDAIFYYLELVESIKSPRCFSGLKKLYLIQSGGLDMGGVTSSNPFVTQTPWALVPNNTLSTAISETPYVGMLIYSNLRSYINVMAALIRQKLEINKTASIQTTGSELPYTTPSFAALYSFNPSPLILGTITDTIRKSKNVLPTNLAISEKTTAFAQLRGVVEAELNRLVSNGGLGTDNSPDLGVVKGYLEYTENLLDQQRLLSAPTVGTAQGLAITIARIHLALLRLLFGQVAPVTQDENIRAGTTYSDRIRISDETLAALPSPTPVLVRDFEETEVPIISRYGALYLASLERAYAN